MTRSQRIALAMRGYETERGACDRRMREYLAAQQPVYEQWKREHPKTTTLHPHTFSVYVRGERGLPCS